MGECTSLQRDNSKGNGEVHAKVKIGQTVNIYIQYNYSGDYRDSVDLIGQGLRHILL